MFEFLGIVAYLVFASAFWIRLKKLWKVDNDITGTEYNEGDLDLGTFLLTYILLPVALLVYFIGIRSQFIRVNCENCKLHNFVHKTLREKRKRLQDETQSMDIECVHCTADLSIPIRRHIYFGRITKAGSYDKYVAQHREEMKKLQEASDKD
jgi:ribosomal protein S27E